MKIYRITNTNYAIILRPQTRTLGDTLENQRFSFFVIARTTKVIKK